MASDERRKTAPRRASRGKETALEVIITNAGHLGATMLDAAAEVVFRYGYAGFKRR
ncbi:hypothetical protein [Pseudomonas sp. 8BK]|uniref:hypothetical protein n=1 Tax=Pseudomonas sp. 8BK TaxID=2653164 RepID=UPI001359BB1F|nr:hypothetical protein [Pseudomonas sp. 8BK]